MRYLGVDYGQKDIGLALSDPEGVLALPLKVLKNSSRLLDELSAICELEGVGEIVLGDSRNYEQQDNPIQKEILDLKERLERDCNYPVHLEPEFLTSREAEREIGRDALSHARAAAIILRSFLARQAS